MSRIEWTDATWNPVRGCSRVSEGCRNCYAERIATRFSHKGAPYEGFADVSRRHSQTGRATTGVRGHWTGRVELIPSKLDEPLRWRKPRRVFVNSMSDLFHGSLPDRAIDRVFAVMAHSGQHTFQILTKRADRMRAYMTHRYRRGAINDAACLHMNAPVWSQEKGKEPSAIGPDWPLPNVWIGVSCEDQQRADERIPLLLQTPAAVRFVSLEPLLGPVDLDCYESSGCPRGWLDEEPGLDWVIVGGESGPGARPMDVAWIRSIVRQCREAGVSAFVKQLGSRPFSTEERDRAYFDRGMPRGSGWALTISDPKGGDRSEWPEDLRIREFPS